VAAMAWVILEASLSAAARRVSILPAPAVMSIATGILTTTGISAEVLFSGLARTMTSMTTLVTIPIIPRSSVHRLI
jgi:hypothetical protein